MLTRAVQLAVIALIIYCIRIIKINMPKVGSIFFKIGYSLYTGTRIGLLYHLRQIRQARTKYPTGHSKPKTTTVNGGLDIIAVPMIEDNYGYIVWNKRDDAVMLVDPSEADAVISYMRQNGVPTPSLVLTTHKHWDHSGGNKHVRRHFPGIRVYGSGVDRPWGVTDVTADQVDINVGDLCVTPYHTPGHTTGHTVYNIRSTAAGAESPAGTDVLFTGDLLFLGGIGRIFEGDGQTMLTSLDKLASLHDDTLVFPGHEYALDNLEFASTIDPGNNSLLDTLNKVKQLRDQNLPTSPSTLREEKQYNVFLRTNVSEIVQATGLSTPAQAGTGSAEGKVDATEERVKVLLKLRKLKDAYKYKL